MCGIAGGIWRRGERDAAATMERARSLLRHRGPDDEGLFVDCIRDSTVALLHTRLAIIDLSIGGHQPMTSEDKRHIIVFNGEIYNYKEIRKELISLGYRIQTDSDTEILLHSWLHWEINCLKKLKGMFAFAVLDRIEGSLFCARDAFGIKPFFVSADRDAFLFASEIPALIHLRDSKAEVDWQRAHDYLLYSDYDSIDRSFVAGVRHLPPAHYLRVDIDSGEVDGPRRWWEPSLSCHDGWRFGQAVEALRTTFLDNIRLHLRSDAPLGIALSGGIDSSAVACAVRHLDPESDIHTFSYVATDARISEEHWIDRVNARIGAAPHKVLASADELVSDIGKMIVAQGEPFGSTSIYAQFRIFKLAKQSGIKVMLEGQGADELLGGYIGYPGERLLSMLERGKVEEALRFLSAWSQWPGRNRREALRQLVSKSLPPALKDSMRAALRASRYARWIDLAGLRAVGVHTHARPLPRRSTNHGRRLIERLAHALVSHNLPALLRHADRNSMHYSIESRVPFLTTDMAELVLSMPEEFLVRPDGETKGVFRAAMRGIVPDEILDRRDKVGFATPEYSWFLSEVEKFREILKSGADIPYLKTDAMLCDFENLLNGERRFSWQFWRWINFIVWYRNFIAA